MTRTMIDRLATMLKAELKGYDAGDDLILISERHSEGSLRELARAILMEMRVPTERMIRTGAVFFELDEDEAARAVDIIYGDMIESELKAGIPGCTGQTGDHSGAAALPDLHSKAAPAAGRLRP